MCSGLGHRVDGLELEGQSSRFGIRENPGLGLQGLDLRLKGLRFIA